MELLLQSAEDLIQQGFSLHQINKLLEAQELYERALELQPNHFEALQLLGVLLAQLNLYKRSLEVLNCALSINSGHAVLNFNLAYVYQKTNQIDLALKSCKNAIACNISYVDAYMFRANILSDLGRHHEALLDYHKAIELNPHNIDLYILRGNLFFNLGILNEALTDFNRAAQINSGVAEIYFNRGNVLAKMYHFEESIADYKKAISIRPDFKEAHWNMSLEFLKHGNFQDGWKYFEWRHDYLGKDDAVIDVKHNLWLGKEDLNNKSLLIHPEFGFGDIIQFCRYIPLIAKMGAKVILVAPASLLSLFTSLEGTYQIVVQGEKLPPYDYQCPIMSLPLALWPSLEAIPQNTPYLKASPIKIIQWANKLGPKNKFRVGVAWNGGLRKQQPELWGVNEARNISLEQIVKINVLEIDFYSLQKGEPAESELRDNQLELWAGENFYNYTSELNDFEDTAALMENLDLVISVDTAVAHLAGAIGRPIWILNRFDACWRWLKDCKDSPWYPTAKLYRQSIPGDWDEVLNQVRSDLLIAAQRSHFVGRELGLELTKSPPDSDS